MKINIVADLNLKIVDEAFINFNKDNVKNAQILLGQPMQGLHKIERSNVT